MRRSTHHIVLEEGTYFTQWPPGPTSLTKPVIPTLSQLPTHQTILRLVKIIRLSEELAIGGERFEDQVVFQGVFNTCRDLEHQVTVSYLEQLAAFNPVLLALLAYFQVADSIRMPRFPRCESQGLTKGCLNKPTTTNRMTRTAARGFYLHHGQPTQKSDALCLRLGGVSRHTAGRRPD